MLSLENNQGGKNNSTLCQATLDHHNFDSFPVTECLQIFYSLLIQCNMINQAGHVLLLCHHPKLTNE